ncbi:hypothetical protein AA0473_0521 [Acetobacter orleanensis NRIC 0473]|uniref:Integrase catalytic domain-containing protein n=2 Tax=Acetobacter orleanensis TaxID=104099 RepID=A0A4Y3TNS7_9PROT|nr:hypothetical protein CO710_09555 [Acetobacter orleanensis]GAN67752.1 transposase [Acetobacter orleanensis JCM 7639]GBR23978.1 hypothetical protein AA0473_0521 [Acetobacter orleanensis NRIC 0473]GEB83089.1 hypothetical protein AOR01nite_15660 [Acetobacter orleanensis]
MLLINKQTLNARRERSASGTDMVKTLPKTAASKTETISAHPENTGLNRLTSDLKTGSVGGQGAFRDYNTGYVYIDVKHPPKLQTTDGEGWQRLLYAAIDRCSNSVHPAVYSGENAVGFLKSAKAIFSFWITHILIDRGPCFTTDTFEKACCGMTIERHINVVA